MSHALLKRSLQIVEETLESNKMKSNKNAKKDDQSKNKRNTSALDLLPESQRLTYTTKNGKNKDKKKINKIKQTQKFTVKQAKNKINADKNKIDSNVQKLLMLDRKFKLNDETTEVLIRRARTGHYVIPEKKVEVEEESVFTPEDFAKFEREYFCN